MAVNIFQMQDFRSFLRATLQDRCRRNPRYSLRAFGRDLGTAPSLISLLINRKRSLSLEKARAISLCLDLKEHEREYFIALVDKERGGHNDEVFALRQKYAFECLKADESLPEELDLEDFALILTIGLLGGIKEDEDSAAILGLEREVLSSLCARLHDLGWLQGSTLSGWSTLRGFVRSESYDQAESNRIFHKKILELGLKQLERMAMHERDFHSFVFSLKAEDHQVFMSDLRAFCKAKVDAYATRESHDRIYTLGLQLLPVAQLERNRKSTDTKNILRASK